MPTVPLDTCEQCHNRTRRLLSIKAGLVSRRCDSCGGLSLDDLPPIDKKVIYLDQLAISEVFKIKSGTMSQAAPHFDFWSSVTRSIDKAVLLQQAVFPASDIHRDETMVFARGNDLALAHEMLAGDVRFRSSWEVERDQLWSYLEAFDQGIDVAPSLSFQVDEILEGIRNEWLPKLHVSARFDWVNFASAVRSARDQTSAELEGLYYRWRTKIGTSFQSVLAHELASFGDAHIEAYRYFGDMALRGLKENDTQLYIDGAMSGPLNEFRQLREHFQRQGLSRDDADRRVVAFWQWPINRSLPHHRIQAYLLAATARKLLSGQKRNPTRGVLNDIRAIGAYAPYVDAMFVDNEFAAYLSEAPLNSELSYKARIFSLRSREEFLEYLERIVANASAEVEQCAAALYGDQALRTHLT